MIVIQKFQLLVAYTYHSTVSRLIEKVQVLILAVVVVVEEQVVEVVVGVVEHFVMNDCYYYCYFHWNDSMIVIRRMVVEVEKNYLNRMNDCYKMIGHNAMALNHNDVVHEKNY